MRKLAILILLAAAMSGCEKHKAPQAAENPHIVKK